MTPVAWGAAVGAVLAGVLDAVENLALLRVISASPDLGADLGPDARVAKGAARAKFGLLLLVIGWLVLIVFPVLVLR